MLSQRLNLANNLLDFIPESKFVEGHDNLADPDRIIVNKCYLSAHINKGTDLWSEKACLWLGGG